MTPYAFRSNELSLTPIFASILFASGQIPMCEKDIFIGDTRRRLNLVVLEPEVPQISLDKLAESCEKTLTAAYEVKVTAARIVDIKKDVKKLKALQELNVGEKAILILDIHWPYQEVSKNHAWQRVRDALELDWIGPQQAEINIDDKRQATVFAAAGFISR